MKVMQPNNFKECLHLLKSEKGFTYSLNLLNPTNGFMVSLEGYEVKTSLMDAEQAFRDFVFQNVSKTVNRNMFFGGWIDESETSKDNVYFDLSKHFQSLKDALLFAVENKQLAIFDIERLTVIELPTPQTSGTEYQKKAYLRQWIDNFVKTY